MTATTPAPPSTNSDDDDEYVYDLPRECPCHTHELLERLDTPLREAIAHVIASGGWTSTRHLPPGLGTALRDYRPSDDPQQMAQAVQRLQVTRWTPVGGF